MKVRALPKININPVNLILLKIAVMGLLGIPFAYLLDKGAYSYYFTRKLGNENFILISYLYTFYAFMVMAILYYVLGLKRRIKVYMNKKIVHLAKHHYEWAWLITFVLASACFAYILIQTGGRHPAFEALRSGYSEIQVLRHNISLTINMNVYNLGFKFFLPINIIIALFFLRRRLLSLISFLLFVLMSTFALEKGLIVSTIILIVIFRILISEIPFKKFLYYGFLSLFLISVMYFLTKFATNMPSLFTGIAKRVFYGQISDLPHYFELFSKYKVTFSSTLPPYITNLFGNEGIKSASRLVMEHIDPIAVSKGTVGVANTFFVGEAYAVGGHIGVLLSPFIVMANLAFFVYLFSRFKKNIFFVFLFSWFLFRIFDGIFGGISYFTFSGIHIILLCLFYCLFSYTFVKNAKKIEKRSKIIKENI